MQLSDCYASGRGGAEVSQDELARYPSIMYTSTLGLTMPTCASHFSLMVRSLEEKSRGSLRGALSETAWKHPIWLAKELPLSTTICCNLGC